MPEIHRCILHDGVTAKPEVPTMSFESTVMLPSGAAMPRIGLGTHEISGASGPDAIAAGIAAGYRLLDTAIAYGNHAEVGEGMRRSGVPRDELFLTTKVRRRTAGAEDARVRIQESFQELGLERLDLLLIHGPNASREVAIDTWRGLISARAAGLVTDIGVSNFSPAQILQLEDATGVLPAVSQVQLSPALQRREDVSFYLERGIVPMAWSPLGVAHGVLEDAVVLRLAATHGVSPAAIAIRWGMQRGHVVIPKSGSAERQRGNLRALEIELSDAEMASLEALDVAVESEWEAQNRAAW